MYVCVLALTEHPMLLVMEFVENGCLRDFLKGMERKGNKTTDKKLLQFTMETCDVSTTSCIHMLTRLTLGKSNFGLGK